MSELFSRRRLLLATVAAMLLPGRATAGSDNAMSWQQFQSQMSVLAADDGIAQQALAERGLQYLNQLDTGSADFRDALAASYETGNRYWLWRRMIKSKNINGGVLDIYNSQMVQLHDHPGATGMLRILSGETEVWQFDPLMTGKESNGKHDVTELVRVSHRILKAGDTAILTPDRGNIHALRAVSKKCSMLDFFAPPYQRSQRNWYEPLAANWFDRDRVICKKIPQDEFTGA